jgi:hypothetical protein
VLSADLRSTKVDGTNTGQQDFPEGTWDVPHGIAVADAQNISNKNDFAASGELQD